MKTYICHWSKLVDRKDVLLKSLETQGFSNFEWVEMYDKDSWDEEKIKEEYPKVFDLNPSGRYLKKSEISLLLKHCYIIKQVANGSDPYALVIEDDVDFCDNFLTRLNECVAEMPDDWDIAWPGDCCNLSLYYYYKEQYIEGKKVYLKNQSRCTHCYLLSKNAANKILSDISNACDGSDFYFTQMIDRFNLSSYWFEPPLATQNQKFWTTIQGNHNS